MKPIPYHRMAKPPGSSRATGSIRGYGISISPSGAAAKSTVRAAAGSAAAGARLGLREPHLDDGGLLRALLRLRQQPAVDVGRGLPVAGRLLLHRGLAQGLDL